jgi:hypothetical protein
MHAMRLALLCSALIAAVVAGTAHASAPRSCGTYSIGPGALRRGSPAGATCLLRAYTGCRPATFRLSSFGVDTIAKDVFRVVRVGGSACHVAVDASFEVVPQQPHLLHATCMRVKRTTNDIVASGCTGSLPATISLTGGH